MTTWGQIIDSLELPLPDFEEDTCAVTDVIVMYEISHFDGDTSFGLVHGKGMSDVKRYGLMKLCTEKESHDIMEGWME